MLLKCVLSLSKSLSSSRADARRRKHEVRIPKVLIFSLPALILVLGSTVNAAERLVWRIGNTDNSTLEFKSKWDFKTRDGLEFVIGKSAAAQDWSAFHPVSGNGLEGSRPHVFRISFELPDQPVGVFFLNINLLFKSPGIPQYVIDINGHKGRFFLSPELSEEIGDPETAWNIIFSRQRLRIPLPASILKKGANRLALACVDANQRPIFNDQASVSASGGLYYDALELTNDTEAQLSTDNELSVLPTIFYIRTEAGLREITMLKLRAPHLDREALATLTFAKNSYSCKLDSQYDFGDSACSVQLPEFSNSTHAELSVRSGDNVARRDVDIKSARKWNLLLAPQMHLDMGYTDYRPNSYEVHARNIDEIVSTLESNHDYKFNPDGAFIWADYWQNRSEDRRKRALAMMQEKRLTLPAQLFTINTGLASAEELFRLFYTSADFSRLNGVPISYANQTDVPAHVWALPSYLQAIGVRYLAISSNPFRGAIIPNGQLNAKSPFWWEGPDGARVLTSFSRQYAQFEQLFTSGNSVSAGIDSLPIFLQTYSGSDYIPDTLLIYGTQSDNRPFLASELKFPQVWNQRFAFPNLRIGTLDEYLAYIEKKFGDSVPTLRGDGGAWWEEMAASDAAYAALARRTKERAIVAEEVASLAAAVDPGVKFPLELDAQIWNNLLLYTEHTWGAARTWKRPESDAATILRTNKEMFEKSSTGEVDDMARRGLSQFETLLDLRGPSVVVFNSLSWPRSGSVEIEIPRGKTLNDPDTGKALRLELIRRNPEEDYDRVRFQAERVPAVGYRCYSIAEGDSASQAENLSLSNEVESQYYRVEVDPQRGGIVSIYDKTLGKELVDRKNHYAMNQYVYAGYSHDNASLIEQREGWNSSLLQYSSALPRPQLDVSTSGGGRVVSVRKTPWGVILSMTTSAVHTPSILTEIELSDREKKIKISNHLRKEAVRAPEAVYFAFPFAADPAKVRYESQNAWIDPESDQLPGANKEWFAAQHWVSVSSPQVSIGLVLNESPLFTIGDIDRGLWPKTLNGPKNVIFSYVMNNYDGDDERPFQGGEFSFTYSITSTANFQPEMLSRFAREEDNPLERDQVTEADKLVWPKEPLGTPASGFLEINSPNVILTAWKGAQDGNGAILRFYNVTASTAETHVKFPHLRFRSAYWTSATENDQGEVATAGDELPLSLKAHEIRTVRLIGLRLQ
jgi:hypothetical protein